MNFRRWLFAAAVAFSAPGIASAQEGSGCGGFRWPLDRERVALADAGKPSLPNGGPLAYDAATTLELQPLGAAQLSKPPERAPKFPDSFAGHFILPAPTKPGIYKVTISSEGWIDVLDGGDFLHPKAFTGARDCDHARKSVKFDLPARPLALQLSGVRDKQIAVIVSPDF
jgi:hypothetical protein